MGRDWGLVVTGREGIGISHWIEGIQNPGQRWWQFGRGWWQWKCWEVNGFETDLATKVKGMTEDSSGFGVGNWVADGIHHRCGAGGGDTWRGNQEPHFLLFCTECFPGAPWAGYGGHSREAGRVSFLVSCCLAGLLLVVPYQILLLPPSLHVRTNMGSLVPFSCLPTATDLGLPSSRWLRIPLYADDSRIDSLSDLFL